MKLLFVGNRMRTELLSEKPAIGRLRVQKISVTVLLI